MLQSIVLDDGIEYLILNDKVIDGIKYTLFANIKDAEDICFRKTIIQDGEEYYVGLDDMKEFEKVLFEFNKTLNG